MNLSSILDKETFPRIFGKAFSEGKQLICMDSTNSRYLEKGAKYVIRGFVGAVIHRKFRSTCLDLQGFSCGRYRPERFCIEE